MGMPGVSFDAQGRVEVDGWRKLLRRSSEHFSGMVFDRLCAFPMLCLVRQTLVRELPESARPLGHAPVRLHVYRVAPILRVQIPPGMCGRRRIFNRLRH